MDCESEKLNIGNTGRCTEPIGQYIERWSAQTAPLYYASGGRRPEVKEAEQEAVRKEKEKEAEIQREEKSAEKQRDMEESERRRQFELEKLKVESETKQKEIEAKEKEAERDFELKKLQFELQSRATESQSNTSVDRSGDHAMSHVPNIKLMKLPPFHEENKKPSYR